MVFILQGPEIHARLPNLWLFYNLKIRIILVQPLISAEFEKILLDWNVRKISFKSWTPNFNRINKGPSIKNVPHFLPFFYHFPQPCKNWLKKWFGHSPPPPPLPRLCYVFFFSNIVSRKILIKKLIFYSFLNYWPISPTI